MKHREVERMPRNRRAWMGLAVLWIAFCTGSALQADGVPVPLGWRLVETQGFHPSPRESGSVFSMPSVASFGVFGGYDEAADISGSTQPTANTFFSDLFIFHAPTATWTRRSSNAGPSPRAFSCAVFHAESERILVFGGTAFAADFSAFTFFDDLWAFDLATDTWSEISPAGPRPSARGGFGCGILDSALYVFSGNGPNFSSDNELWRFDINAESWTLLQADATGGPDRPVARTGMTFQRVPGKNRFLMTGGDAFDPFPVPVTQEDMWIYNVNQNRWRALPTRDKPEPARTSQASVMISSRLLWAQNGDAQGDQTGDDVCPAPLFCLSPPTPTNDTFVYDTARKRWTEPRLLFGSPPPTRRSMIVRLGNTIYLFGGYGWDGVNGVGKIANPYTWALRLNPF